ncbi:MAG: hypothetical protein SV062_08000 [Thermodesulfobacteriota bacterium]|nr:hypothetical protein [Thermodesulfobacteriota bacterium]
MSFKPIARAFWSLQFRIYDNQSIVPWCEYTGIDVEYFLQCINKALTFWNEAMPGDGLVFAPEFLFNWSSQPNIEWQIPNWIKLETSVERWAGQGTQNLSKYSNECIKGFITIEGYNGSAIYTKPNGIDNYEVSKEDVLSWIFKHELGHILGLSHVYGDNNQNNIMHSGNRDMPLAIQAGIEDIKQVAGLYPTPVIYKQIYGRLYWKCL